MKKIKNVGAVDIRFASEETLKNISSISNTGVVLYSKRVKPFMNNISITNAGMVEELSEDYEIEIGNIEITKNSLEVLDKPLKKMVVGILTVTEDVTPELIKDKIGGLYNVGIIECPKELIGYLKTKVVKNAGMVREIEKNKVRIQGKKDITNQWLNSLEDNSNLDVMGVVSIINDIDVDLFNKKINKIELMGVARLRESYQAMFETKAKDGIKGRITIIPDNCLILKAWQEIDTVTLKRYKAERLFSRSCIIINPEVEPADIDNGIEAILAAKRIYVPKHILDSLIAKVNEDIEITSFEGKLLVNSGDRTITQLELQYAPNAYYIVNNGDLIFADDINPDTFVEKINKIDNFADIEVKEELFGLVQMKLNINKGEVINTSLEKEEDIEEDVDVVSNMGYYKL